MSVNQNCQFNICEFSNTFQEVFPFLPKAFSTKLSAHGLLVEVHLNKIALDNALINLAVNLVYVDDGEWQKKSVQQSGCSLAICGLRVQFPQLSFTGGHFINMEWKKGRFFNAKPALHTKIRQFCVLIHKYSWRC